MSRCAFFEEVTVTHFSFSHVFVWCVANAVDSHRVDVPPYREHNKNGTTTYKCDYIISSLLYFFLLLVFGFSHSDAERLSFFKSVEIYNNL